LTACALCVRACEVFALAAGCGPFVAVPISASATSAHVAATIAVPSTVAGRESAVRSRGAWTVSCGRRRCRGGDVAGVEASGSQVEWGSGALSEDELDVVQSAGSQGVAERGGSAGTGLTGVGVGSGLTGVGSGLTGAG
jgi:hypothetical protein